MIRFCRRWRLDLDRRCRRKFTLASLRRGQQASSRPESVFDGEWCNECEEDAWQDYLSMPVF